MRGLYDELPKHPPPLRSPVPAVCDSAHQLLRPQRAGVHPDATGEYVLARIQFDNITTEPPIGCVPLEDISGTFIVEHFCQRIGLPTPKT